MSLNVRLSLEFQSRSPYLGLPHGREGRIRRHAAAWV